MVNILQILVWVIRKKTLDYITINYFTKNFFSFSKKTHNEKKILCISCSNDNVDVKATHFCKTCTDPAPLCESCAKQHTRQKLASNHDVCVDITYFSTLQPKDGYLTKSVTKWRI